MIAEGAIGAVRHVQVEYLQDWLADPWNRAGRNRPSWRTDPGMSGEGGCIADIGTHAVNLATFCFGAWSSGRSCRPHRLRAGTAAG